MEDKKIILACSGKFHYFDLADQLNYHKKLKYLVSDYPYFLFSINKKNFFFLNLGIYGNFIKQLSKLFTNKYIKNILYNYTFLISKSISRHIGNNEKEIIIINSTFAYETFNNLKKINFNKVLDHGSLHMKFEKKVINKLSNNFNLDYNEDDIPNWVIDREDEEFNLADKIVVLSPLAKKTLVDYGVNSKKIEVIMPGVNLATFYPKEKKKDLFTIGQIGGIRLRKGVFDTIYAFRNLKSNYIKLILVGSPYFSPKISRLFFNYVTSSNRIHFYNSVNQTKLLEIYNSCDVIIHPSLADGFGLVVLQAMACGKIVICTETTGASHLIRNEENGFIVPPNSPDKIAEIINFLIENPKKKKEIEDNIIKQVKNFSWNNYSNEYVKFLYQHND